MIKYKTCLILFLLSCGLVAQESEKYKDIQDAFLHNMISETDSSTHLKFQNFAVRLFMDGKSVNEDYFRRLDQKIIGVSLIKDTNQIAEFNLFALNYGCIKESLPVTAGSKGIASFYVKCNNEKEREIVQEAVKSYLKENQIPVTNKAYQFCTNFEYSGNEYEHIYQTDGISAIMPGQEFSLYRKNGNYIIEILGKTNDSEQKNKTPGDYFSKNWMVITVYIIDQKSGKAYGRVF